VRRVKGTGRGTTLDPEIDGTVGCREKSLVAYGSEIILQGRVWGGRIHPARIAGGVSKGNLHGGLS